MLQILGEELDICKTKMCEQFYSELYGQFGADDSALVGRIAAKSVEIANRSLDASKNQILKLAESLALNDSDGFLTSDGEERFR